MTRARLALALVLAASCPASAAPRLLAAVGDVTAASAVVWVRGEREGGLTVEHGPAGAPTAATAALRVSRAADLTAKLRLDGLAPGTRYAYRVQGGGASVAGEFVTAPAPETSAAVTLQWSGDLGGGRFCRPVPGGYRIFGAMAARRPDFFLFVGDTIYGDHRCAGPDVVTGGDFVATTLAGFRAKHLYNREDPALSGLLGTTSVYAIWDDHEVRNDFAGSVEPLMPVGRQAFLDYWPIAPPPEDPNRLYRKFRWGRLVEVFILDTRQYRSANSEPDGPGKTMLGPAQKRWLLDEIGGSSATWKVVVSSVSLSISTGRAARDSWSNASVWGLPEEGTGFATERDAIVKALRDRGVKNLVFLVADVHHAEVIRHRPWPDFVFHELVAGPLSASQGRPRPLDAGLNPQSLFARGGVNNFGELAVEPGRLTVRVIDEAGQILFTHALKPE